MKIEKNTIITIEMILQLVKLRLNTSQLKRARKMVVFASILLLFIGTVFAFAGELSSTLIIFAVGIILLFATLFGAPLMLKRNMFKANEALIGTSLRILLTDEGIECDNAISHTHFKWNEVTDLVQVNDYTALFIAGQTAVIFNSNELSDVEISQIKRKMTNKENNDG